LTSVHFGKEWSAKAASVQASIQTAQSSISKNESLLAELSQQLQASEKGPDALDKALANLLLDAYNLRIRYGVTVATAAPSRLGSGGMAALSEIAEAVPNSSLSSVRVNLSGSYETYPGLMAYLEALRTHPAALVRIKVQDRGFELSLRVFGTMNP